MLKYGNNMQNKLKYANIYIKRWQNKFFYALKFKTKRLYIFEGVL